MNRRIRRPNIITLSVLPIAILVTDATAEPMPKEVVIAGQTQPIDVQGMQDVAVPVTLSSGTVLYPDSLQGQSIRFGRNPL
jgi:hypothetical protein